MANTAVISRTHLIYGVCLPLAVLIGYLLAEPFELGSIAVVVAVLGVLSIPLLMRWHHPLLILSFNAAIYPYFVPGRPTLWMIASAISFFFLALNRAMGSDVRFFRARNVSRSLIFLTLVVIATAYLSGGMGFAIFGNRSVGSKRYLVIFLSVLAYFGLSTIPIKRRWAERAVYVYFLSSITGLIGYLVALAGPAFYFMVQLFPIEGAVDELNSSGMDLTNQQITRYGGLLGISMGLYSFLFARYGVRGLLDMSRPWRLMLFVLAMVAGMYSGFRSAVILPLLIFALLFYVEGLFRTRLFPILILVGILGGATTLAFMSKLPFSVQRSLAFLPLNVDPMVRQSAEASSAWRVEMWKEVLPTIPRYLIKGKGLALNPEDMNMLAQAQQFGTANSYEGSEMAGDYHSGPLSIIIPFGLFGVAGFIWFLSASVKVLRENYLFGDPSLSRVNSFLLVLFIARIIFYFLIFGSFFSDLMIFASLVGLSVSINGGVCQPPDPHAELETQ
jgi:O-Antigen ligase